MINVSTIKIGLIAKILTVGSPNGMKQVCVIRNPNKRLGKFELTLTYYTFLGLASHVESFDSELKRDELFDSLTRDWLADELLK